MADKLGLQVGLEFESFNDANKKLQKLLKQLEQSNKFKLQIDTGTTTEIKKQLDSLSKTSLSNLNNQYTSLANNSKIVANEQDRIAEKISNFQRIASVQISALKRQYGDLVPQKELQSFEKQVDNLTGTSLPDVNKNIRGLRISFRELKEETKQNESQLISLGTVLSQNVSKFATFFSVQKISELFFNELRKGIDSVIELDRTLTTLSITMNGNEEQFTELTDSASQLAISMGSTIPTALELVRIYANLGESIESVTDKLQATIAVSNLAGLSGSETADVIQGLVIQYGNSSEALLDTTTRVSDSLAAISSELGVDFGKGLREISEGLRLSGSILTEYNVTLEESEALIGALVETTRRSGSEIARSLQFFSSRIFEVNESFQEQTGFINKVERQLDSMDVAIRNSDGSFRSLFDILEETSKAMNNLSDEERSETASLIAGTRQRAQFLALQKSFPRVLELTESALNSQGEALEKNEIFMQSIEGRMNTLRATVQEFWNTVINSDFIKNGITLLTDLIKSFDALADSFGGNVAVMGAFATLIGGRGLIISGLRAFQGLLLGSTAAMQGLSVATVGATAGLALIPIILGKMASHVRETNQRIQEGIDSIREFGKTSEDVKPLLNQQMELEEQLKDNTLTTQEYTEKQSQLRDIQSKIAQLLPDATTAENEFGESLATSARATEDLLRAQEELAGQTAQETIAELGGEAGIKATEELLEGLLKEQEELRALREEFANTGAEVLEYVDLSGELVEIYKVDLLDSLNDVNDSINKQRQRINQWNTAAKVMEDVLGQSVPLFDNFLETQEEVNDAQEESVEITNAQSQSFEDLNDQLDSSEKSLSSINSLLSDYNDNQMFTIESLSEIIEKYPELIKFLNNEEELKNELIKLADKEKETQQNLINSKIAISEEFYKFIEVREDENLNMLLEKYGMDLTNFKNLEEAKTKIAREAEKKRINAIQELRGQMLDTEDFLAGLQNIQDEFSTSEIEDVFQDLIGQFAPTTRRIDFDTPKTSSTSTSTKKSADEIEKVYESQIDSISILDSKINDINSALEKQQNIIDGIDNEISMLGDSEEDRLQKIKLINQQIEEQRRLEEQVRSSRQKLIQELGQVRGDLSDELGIDIGVASDEDIAQRFNELFSGQRTFGSEEEQQQFEQRIERIKNLMSDMDTIQTEIANTTQQIDDVNKNIFDSEKSILDIREKMAEEIKESLRQKAEEVLTDGKGLDELKERSDLLQERIDRLKEIDKIKQREEDREKRLKAIEEARIRLQNAQGQRNVRLFTGERFEFVADPREVKKAQDELDSLQEQHREKTEQEELDRKIRKLEERKQDNDQLIRDTEETLRNLETNITNYLNRENVLFRNSGDDLNNIVDDTFEKVKDTYGKGIDDIIEEVTPKINELNGLLTSAQAAFLELESVGNIGVENQTSGLSSAPSVEPSGGNVSNQTNNNYNFGDIALQGITNPDSFLDRMRQYARE